jgi:DNA-binding GntR family transcriptional regulator
VEPDRLTVQSSAYDQIRRNIVEGRYRPGQRLIEQRIAEELELSRTPVREALRMLQSEGLVRVEPNRGAAVRRLTVDDIADLYDFRARLEGYAAELASQRATADQLDRIRAATDGFDDATSGRRTIERVHEAARWNNELHGTLVAAAAHERLQLTLARTVDHPLVFQALRKYDDDEMARSRLFHHLIVEAVGAGEPARAGRLMSEHVLQGRDVLLSAVDRLVSLDDLFDEEAAPSGT